jgi:hypothetical protein
LGQADDSKLHVDSKKIILDYTAAIEHTLN